MEWTRDVRGGSGSSCPRAVSIALLVTAVSLVFVIHNMGTISVQVLTMPPPTIMDPLPSNMQTGMANFTSAGHSASGTPTCSFKSRDEAATETCPNVTEPIRPYFYFLHKVPKYFNILVDDKHKLLFCSIPKAGSSSWKNYLVLMSDKGRKQGTNIGGKVHNRPILMKYGLRFLSGIYNKSERQRRLSTYSKFVVVRHPFTRLYSAYKNKYLNGAYSVPITRNILRKYRNNPKAVTNDNLIKQRKIYPTFEEFARFVVGEYRTTFREAHWARYQDLCYPCEVGYQHIIKMETMQADTERFRALRFIADAKDIRLPNLNPSKASNQLKFAFDKLPSDLVKQLYKLYQDDFTMFGYTWDFASSSPGCNVSHNECC